jgi:hypothetical protein
LADLAQIEGNELVMYPESGSNSRTISASIIDDSNGNPYAVHLVSSYPQSIEYEDFPLSTLEADGVNTLVMAGTAGGNDTITVDPLVTTVGSLQYLGVNTEGEAGSDDIDFSNFTAANSHLLGLTISGSNGNNTIVGTYAPETINLGNGTNTVMAGGGGDEIVETSGNDTITGGDGNNTLVGGSGKSEFLIGNGNNQVFAGSGMETINVGDGKDLIESGAGTDQITAGNGDNKIYGDAGGSSITVGAGQDIVYAFGAQNNVSCGGGNDFVTVGAGTNSVNGGTGNTELVVSADANQTLFDGLVGVGASGTTTFTNVAAVSLFGGPGNESFNVSGWNGLPVQINGGGGNDTIVSIDNTDFTLTDSSLTRSDGTSFALNGITYAELTSGATDNTFDVTGWHSGGVITGGGGLDTLTAGNLTSATLTSTTLQRQDAANLSFAGISGADLSTILTGNASVNAGTFPGNVDLYGEGSSDTLMGGSGGNYIVGGSGSGNRLVGNGGGNNQISGGSGSSDSIFGGTGSNLLVGASGGLDSINSGSGVSHVYTTAGNDTINATSGTAYIYASGTSAQINTGSDTNDQVMYPGAAGTEPSDFVPPVILNGEVPPAPPAPAATLPSGPNLGLGQWTEFSGSASGGGVSSSPGAAIEPSVVASASDEYVAWADNRSGIDQIYVAENTPAGWVELAGSDQANGISNSSVSSSQPSIALDASGNPMVAWTEINGSSSDVYAADYSPTANGGAGGWIAIGTSLSAGGLSNTGHADDAKIVETSTGPVVAWLDTSSGQANVFARQYNGASWVAFGAGAASGEGLTQSSSAISGFALAASGTNVALAWAQPGTTAGTSIFVLQNSGSSWQPVDGSASGSGISGPYVSSMPSIAYDNGAIYVAWAGATDGTTNIQAATAGTSSWTAVSIDTPASAGSNQISRGAASSPQLSANGGALELAWVEDRLPGTPDQAVAIYANQLENGSFVRQLDGDASYNGILGRSTSLSQPQTLAVAVNAAGVPFVTWGDSSSGSSQVYFVGDTLSIQKIIYVNDAYSVTDVYTTAAGSTSNTGLTPATPLSTIQAALNLNLSPGDVILVDGGTYSGFTATSADNGVLIIGSPGAPSTITGAVQLNGVQNVFVQGLAFAGGVTVSGGGTNELFDDAGGTSQQVANGDAGGVTLSSTSTDLLSHDEIGSLALTGSTTNISLVNSIVEGSGVSIKGASTGLLIENDQLKSLDLDAASQGNIASDNIFGGGLDIASAFTGDIAGNLIHGALVGVTLAAAAPLNDNRIYTNSVGMIDTINNQTTGLGFASQTTLNLIFGNGVGVNVTGPMQDQEIEDNLIGVIGSGVLGGTSLDTANVIQGNDLGVDFDGTVQYNRFTANGQSILVQNSQTIEHNLFYDGIGVNLETQGASNVEIVSNTFYSANQTNIEIDDGSADVEVLDNIMWTGGGYDLDVADNSRTGFFSNYNDLYNTGTGLIVHYLIDFSDILDWQDDLNQFDLQSIGTTVVNPTEAQPQFVDLSLNDFRVYPTAAGIRYTSPTVATGDPVTDVGLTSAYQNLLVDPSFENGVSGWTVNVGGTTQSGDPTAFDGNSYFYSGSVASGFAQQTINLTATNTAAQLDSQSLDLIFGGRIESGDKSTPDQGEIILTFLDANGNVIGTSTIDPASNQTTRWELVGSRVHIPVGARSVVYRFQNLRESGSTDESYLDAAFVYVVLNTVATDIGAYGDTAEDQENPVDEKIQLQTPDLYVNWTLNQQHQIYWSTFGNTGDSNVQIDLYQDGANGPQFLATIASSVPDNGTYTWIPANTGLTYGTYGLRIEVSLVGNSAIDDRSTETFAIPPNGSTYYINDGSTSGDQYTTAPGSNRNTGLSPSSPLPMLTTLLRTYAINSSDTIYIDNGSYVTFQPAVFSSNPALGDGAGATVLGPTNSGTSATIAALGYTNDGVIDVNDASFVTMKNLTLIDGEYGLWVLNGSQNLTASYITAEDNLADGIHVDSTSTGAAMDHVTASDNGSDGVDVAGSVLTLSEMITDSNADEGIYVGSTFASITSSTSDHNGNAGYYLANAGSGVITSSEASFDTDGIDIGNTAGGTSVVGNTNLSLNLGNIVHDTSGYGINASALNSSVIVAGNTVYNIGDHGDGPVTLSGSPIQLFGQIGGNPPTLQPPSSYLVAGTYYYRIVAILPAGPSLPSPEMSVPINYQYGEISLSWTTVPGATEYEIYRGTQSGEEEYVTTTSSNSYLDNNAITPSPNSSVPVTDGFPAIFDAGGGGTIAQNVVYTSVNGIQGEGVPVTNNRVYDIEFDGIYSNGGGNTIQGNVVYGSNIGIYLLSAGQVINNLIYQQNSPTAAMPAYGIYDYGAANFTIAGNTIYELVGDAINVAGGSGLTISDNILWTGGGYDIDVQQQNPPSFQSDYNLFYTTGSGQVGFFNGVARSTLNAWRLADATDPDSLYAQPLFVNPAGADGQLGYANNTNYGDDDDFHDQSIAGSFHGGALAPIVSGTTGLPVTLTATLTADPQESPVIDRGNPAASYSLEPIPNGGFINIGAYGDTAQASESPIPYVLIIAPNGGETPLGGQNYTIEWRSEDTSSTVNISLLQGSSPQTASPVLQIASGVANSGSYVWAIPSSLAPASNYYISITRVGPPSATSVSAAAFTIQPPATSFYVNGNTVNSGDFTTAPGNDANDGLTPATPKATIAAIFQAYVLGPGDTIFVNEGTYSLSSNIVIPAADSGVTIEGYNNPQYPGRATVFNRGSTSTGSYIFDVQGAMNVTLEDMTLTDAAIAINASNSAGATGLSISNNIFTGDYVAVSLGTGNNGAVISGNQITGISTISAAMGIFSNGNNVTISNNLVHNNQEYGIYIEGGTSVAISGNTVYANSVGIAASVGTISGNLGYSNTSEAILTGGTVLVTGNTTYNNTGAIGIYLQGGTASGNVSYGNAYGIYLTAGTVTGNLVYGNSVAGIDDNGSTGAITDNVTYSNSWGLIVTNDGGLVANDLIYNNTAGGIDLSNGVPAIVMEDTIYQPTGNGLEIDDDAVSTAAINVRDNIIWTQNGYDLDINPVSDSKFTSDYNDLYVTGSGQIGNWQNVGIATLSGWQSTTSEDFDSLSADPLFVSVATGDFHVTSQYGSFHGGSLAVTLNPSTDLPMAVPTPSPTDDSQTSPTIDRGAPGDSFSNEPSPNGGFANLGSFGDTNQASISPATYVLVTHPNGGEVWVTQQVFTIQWRDDSIGSGTVNIDLMQQVSGTLTLAGNIVTGTSNSGSYSWIIPAGVASASNYFVRVTEVSSGAIGVSSGAFSIATGTGTYYVNDSTVNPGDICTAPGNDSNSGLTPATPKATIQSVLSTYTLSAGAKIIVDQGFYTVSTNILLTAAENGIIIEGPGAASLGRYATIIDSDSPTNYYRLGDSSGTVAADSSGNGQNATYVNGVTLGQTGAPTDTSTAAEFSGASQYVQLPSGFANFANGFSFDVWVNPSAQSSNAPFFDLGNGTSNELYFARQTTSNNLILGGSYGSVTVSNVLQQNTWQYLAVTITSSGAVTIYRNGLSVGAGTITLPADVTRSTNYLSRSNNSSNAYYAGLMQEAAFYGTALTATQIANHYSANGQAILNRGNANSGSEIFQLDGATGLTLENLTLSGGYSGIVSTSGVASSSDTMQNCIVYNNAGNGIDFTNNNVNNFTLTNSTVYDNGIYGIYGSSLVSLTITNSTFSDETSAIDIAAAGGTISGNTVDFDGNANDAALGVESTSNTPATLVTVSNNVVYNSSSYGIYITSNVLAEDNTVYNTTAGIGLYVGGEALNNVSYANATGIDVVAGGMAIGNQVYDNSGAGIVFSSGSTVTGNTVYSNGAWGIRGGGNASTGANEAMITNNLIYNNGTGGFLTTLGEGIVFTNNTIYEAAGTAFEDYDAGISPTVATYPMTVQNNIFETGAGPVYTLDDWSLYAFQSDYNDICSSGAGSIATVYVDGDNAFESGPATNFTVNSTWIAETAEDMHGIFANPQFVNAAAADFHVQSTSPTIDAGNPTSEFAAEPQPNGGRVNLGYDGNTPQAATSSAATSVQVTSPSVLQKLQAGQPTTIQWISTGLLATQTITEVNVGGLSVGEYHSDEYKVYAPNTGAIDNSINTSLVANPAPQAVYQTFAYANSGIGNYMSYLIPVPNGTYTIRLDWAEPSVSAGQRKFDVLLQGQTVQSEFDVAAAAGNVLDKAVALTFTVTATNGSGISLELLNDTTNPAFLNGFEISAANPGGAVSPTANVEASMDGGNTWTTIATNQLLDLEGRGSVLWTPPLATSGYTALIRVVANNAASTSGASGAFLIAPAGNNFYVNENSSAGGTFTTAGGSDLNDGKTPATPMSSIQAVINDYHPGAGQTIFVDSATYALLYNTILPASDSGVTIEGPAGNTAVINRGNNSPDEYDFDFQGAANVTLENLSITGAYIGINANNGEDSTGVEIINDTIFSNKLYNLSNGGDSGWTITGNSIHDASGTNQSEGISISNAENDVISNNTIFNNLDYGISISGASGSTNGVSLNNVLVNDNTIYANGAGISADDGILVSGNVVYSNANDGIDALDYSLIVGNTIYKQTLNEAAGIDVAQAEARSNVVYDNYIGILAGSTTTGTPTLVDRNKVYSNTEVGLEIYANAFGTSSDLIDNLVYANASYGIYLHNNDAGSEIIGNTVYQINADAVNLVSSPGEIFYNNVLWTQSGYDFDLDTASQTSFTSDYNDLYASGAGKIGLWNGTVQAALTNWQSASGQDAQSVGGNPDFVNVAGADTVLGYNPNANGGQGYNGGADDDFYPMEGSPAIDSGSSWVGYGTDITGAARYDDANTSNTGSNDYFPAVQSSSLFNASSGTAENWKSGTPEAYGLSLPFSFPYYGSTFTSVYVSTTGVIGLGSADAAESSANSDSALLASALIAPMWGNLETNQTGDNIYVDTTVANQVTIRWAATNVANGAPVNFAVVLFSNGQIRFDYGSGNTGLTPTVGISKGDGQHDKLTTYDGQSTLSNADSILFTLAPGYADMGAYEFHGAGEEFFPPTFTSAGAATFTFAQNNSYVVTTIPGFPSSTALSISGTLPIGLTFTDEGNGNATITGTPTGANGIYPLTITAGDGLSSTQSFTLTIGQAPALTSAGSAMFTAGASGSFAVTTTSGFPTSTTISESGTLPAGLTFTNNGNGTATISGTPAAGSGGVYAITLTATNGLSVNQLLAISVDQTPSITSGNDSAFMIGQNGSFQIISTGYPAANLSETGPLPSGVTFQYNGDGTATISGAPASGSAASYPLTILATNATGTSQQIFTLTVSLPSETWTGTADGINWSNPGNWSGGSVPNQNTDATIPAGIAGLTIGAGMYSVASLTSASPIALNGMLSLYGPAVFTGSTALTIGAGGTLNVDDGGTISGVVIDNGNVLVDFSTDPTINANISGSGALTMIGSGALTLTGDNTYTGPTTVSNGILVIGAADALPAGGAIVNNALLSIQVGSSALPVISGNISGSGSLTIGTASTSAFLKLAAGSGTFGQSALTIYPGSSLDVTDNNFIINYGSGSDPDSTIYSYLASGYSGGAWNGSGIISSSVATENASQSKLIYAVGYADGADGIVGGLNSGEFEIMPTLSGDAKMQGNVVFGDFQLLSQYFGKPGTWDEGNFTYGSSVDFGDFQLLSQNFGQTSSLSAATGDAASQLAQFAANSQNASTGIQTSTPARAVAAAVANSVVVSSSIESPATDVDPGASILDGTFLAGTVNGLSQFSDVALDLAGA